MVPDPPYQWQKKDKIIYTIALLPFLLAFGGAICLLWARACRSSDVIWFGIRQ